MAKAQELTYCIDISYSYYGKRCFPGTNHAQVPMVAQTGGKHDGGSKGSAARGTASGMAAGSRVTGA